MSKRKLSLHLYEGTRSPNPWAFRHFTAPDNQSGLRQLRASPQRNAHPLAHTHATTANEHAYAAPSTPGYITDADGDKTVECRCIS